MMKEAMAWAFSAMPEAIQVVLKELKDREEELKEQTAVPNYGFGNYGNQNQNQNPFGFNSGLATPRFASFGLTFEARTTGSTSHSPLQAPSRPGFLRSVLSPRQMPQAFGKWWNTQRRLRESDDMGVDAAGASLRSENKTSCCKEGHLLQ